MVHHLRAWPPFPLFAALVSIPGTALAEPSAQSGFNAPAQDNPPPAAPYSLPWQLRPAGVANVVRADTSVASFENADSQRATSVATLITGGYKVTSEMMPFVRVGLLGLAPADGDGGASLTNVAIGAFYAPRIARDFRLALVLGAVLPTGTGGGDHPSRRRAATNRSGSLTRSAMDGSMFAVNDLTTFGGVDFAYVAQGLTVQVEATVNQAVRVRGAQMQPDAFKTNFTSGFFVGYFVLTSLSLGAEIRYQRWLSTPTFVAADASGDLRDTLSAAGGARLHFKLGDSIWIRPGVSYARGLDDPMLGQGYHIVQLDLPVYF
jgi:hypothetical protein